jgi:hypothetical protein
MFKNYLPLLLGVSVVSFANADEEYIHTRKHAGRSMQEFSHLVEKGEGLSGYACYTYKYVSDEDKKQTLGILKHPEAPMPEPKYPISEENKKVIKHKPKVKQKAKTQKEKLPSEHGEEQEMQSKEATQAPSQPLAAENKHDTSIHNVKAHEPITDKAPTSAPIVPTPVIPSNPSISTPAMEVPKPVVPKVEAPKMEADSTINAAPIDHAVQVPMPALSSRASVLNFNELVVNLTDQDNQKVLEIAKDMIANSNLAVKIDSYSYDKNNNHADARRVALQRAISVRKLLFDAGANPNNISVNAVEDLEQNQNKLEITLYNPSTDAATKK